MKLRLGVGVVGAALVLAAVAVAASHLTATGVRIGDHPGFVRVVVDFRGGTVKLGEVELGSTNRLFTRGRTSLTITRTGIRSTAAAANSNGVRVRLTRSGNRITVALAGAGHRFKAVQESALHHPERLLLDLWKAAPPTAAATVRNDGCLALDQFTVSSGKIVASGRALQPLFENALVLQVRSAGGAIRGIKPVTASHGRWTGTVRYHVSLTGRGTLEAAVFSAKDGSLECLAQVPVTLTP